MNPDERAAEVFALLGGKRSRDGYQCHCPAHDDRKPSLSVTPQGDDLLLFCHAGCDYGEVVAALNALGLHLDARPVEPPPLFREPSPPPTGDRRQEEPAQQPTSAEGKAIAPPLRPTDIAYVYLDAGGNPTHRTVRTAGKSFLQQGFREGEWWSWLAGVTPVLYHLPDLLDADPALPVFFCEGEKDADRLRSLGLVATTNPGGAKAWQDHYAAFLRDRQVILLEDNDESGRKATAIRGQALKKAAASVRVLTFPQLPEHGDVSDWLDTGGSTERLLTLAAEAPIWEDAATPRLKTVAMEDVEVEEITWLWLHYLPRGKFVLVEGDPGAGKGFLVCQVASCLSTGRPLPGEDQTESREPMNVLLIMDEDGLGDTVKPRLVALHADLSHIRAVTGLLVRHEEGMVTLNADGVSALEREIVAFRPAMVVIDPIVSFLGEEIDMFRANEIRAALRPLADLAARYGTTMLCVRHLNKNTGMSAINRGYGSVDISAIARAVLVVANDPEDAERHIVAVTKMSLAKRRMAWAFALQGDGPDLTFTWEDEPLDLDAQSLLSTSKSSGGREDARQMLMEILWDQIRPQPEVMEIMHAAGFSTSTIRRAKESLGIDSVRLSPPGAAKGTGGWAWSLPAHVRYPKSEHLDHLDQNGVGTPLFGPIKVLTDPIKVLTPRQIDLSQPDEGVLFR